MLIILCGIFQAYLNHSKIPFQDVAKSGLKFGDEGVLVESPLVFYLSIFS